ncbi:DUF3299 domain-containing protein [Parasedimentitalea maritima]|uniref:DUF3299 domain-containing protein n=1 Tax=Parasedimentitalea maritima TaxID=2578117 RepID=A0A6A4RB25_9RHOB|nr:DUF3299 domain-containing protein [Zongyanglinia marina]KAE9625555.1 DUF3299 domain-containing protein [Zongyanglinia marina]
MNTIRMAIAAAFTVAFVVPATARDLQDITWVDLLPEERPYHDPFAKMDYDQISDLSELYRFEVMSQEDLDDAARAEVKALRESLEEQGLDPDQLFKQREIVMNQRRLAAIEPNPDVVGKNVRLPGYLLPLEMVDQKAVEFLLVPTVGACIHTPPPPANQMVFVRYEEGFEVDGLYNPVWISGEMRAQSHSSALYLVDGQTDIETTYVVDAVSVDAYQ